jgi:aminoglycoside phosphotransferase (APT) family kinase protein
MNPETNSINKQITALFGRLGLPVKNIKRVTVGFTNEIHEVDDYILKVYIRGDGEGKMKQEAKMLAALHGKALVPELVVADSSRAQINKPYLIYKKIPGHSLGHVWHELTDEQRRDVIKELCRQVKIITLLEPNAQLPAGQTWRGKIMDALWRDMAIIKGKDLLPALIQDKIEQFVQANKHVLDEQKLSLLYWDVHLDNVIADEQGRMVGLIDLEHVEVGSIDYLLDVVRQMERYPWLTLSENYQHLLAWYKEFYSELFEFTDLEKRLDLYELEGILRLLPRFPKAQQLHDRLAGILKD